MNKGFTKLEIILFGIILLFIVGYLLINFSSLSGNNENLLRQRFNKFISLLDVKNYTESYNFYSSSIKNKGTLEEYIKSFEGSSDIERQKVNINGITIKNNIGYLDTSSTICEDVNCSTKKELRNYKKWVFENGNWFYSPPNPRCLREEMYDMPSEFKRALSLIKQRLMDKASGNEENFDFFNCLDIQYSDLEEEGVFTFNTEKSSIDKLSILVNRSYISSDDLLTAFLLSHEMTHANDYLTQISDGIKFGCVESEVKAFTMQLFLSSSLTEEEMKTINLKLREGYGNINNQLKIMWDLLTYRDYARKMCNTFDYNDCFFKYFNKSVENMIKSNPYYQKQCNLN